MALSAVFLATFIGLCTASYAFFTGHVGVWGALGLYVSAGWAAIIALLISNLIIRSIRKTNRVLSQDMHEQPVMMSKHASHRHKSGA